MLDIITPTVRWKPVFGINVQSPCQYIFINKHTNAKFVLNTESGNWQKLIVAVVALDRQQLNDIEN